MPNETHNFKDDYAFKLLEDSYNAHKEWANQLQEAHAFILANGEEPQQGDLDLMNEVQAKVTSLRNAMLKVLS